MGQSQSKRGKSQRSTDVSVNVQNSNGSKKQSLKKSLSVKGLSSPSNFQKHISITKDPKTGKLLGVPVEWVPYVLSLLDLKISQHGVIEQSQTKSYQNLPKEVRTYELPPEIIKFMQKDLLSSMHMYDEPESSFNAYCSQEIDIVDTYSLQTSYSRNKLASKSAIFGRQRMLKPKIRKEADFQTIIDSVKFLDDNPALKYKFEDQLGKGACCTVYRVTLREDPEKSLACRIIKSINKTNEIKIKKEIAIMEQCTSPFIVKHIETYYYSDCLFMFEEYMDGGTLTEFLYQFKGRLNEELIAYVLGEILKGLEIIHRNHHLHRDLKSDNILIDRKGSIKIADFGYASILSEDKLNRRTCVGTPAWMAPELIQNDDYNDRADVWSFGIIGIELAKGEPPYLKVPPRKAMAQIVKNEPPQLGPEFSYEFRDFVNSCLRKEKSLRPDTFTLLNHNFLKKANKEQFMLLLRDKKSLPLNELLKELKKNANPQTPK